MIIHFPAASNDWRVHVRIKSGVCLCVHVSESLVDPTVFPVLSRQQADEVAGSSERKHYAASTWTCMQVSAFANETYQCPVNCTKAMEVPRSEEGLLLSFLAQIATAIQRREKHGNEQQQLQQQQQQPNIKPLATTNTAGSKPDVERSISLFLGQFMSSSLHFFVCSPGSEKRAGQDATWTL